MTESSCRRAARASHGGKFEQVPARSEPPHILVACIHRHLILAALCTASCASRVGEPPRALQTRNPANPPANRVAGCPFRLAATLLASPRQAIDHTAHAFVAAPSSRQGEDRKGCAARPNDPTPSHHVTQSAHPCLLLGLRLRSNPKSLAGGLLERSSTTLRTFASLYRFVSTFFEALLHGTRKSHHQPASPTETSHSPVRCTHL